MSKRLKGITIEIEGDTLGLEKSLGEVNKKSRALQSELRDVEKLLKFNPGNAEAMAQKQQLLSEQVSVTAEKLNALKAVQQQVQQQFDNGDIGVEQYRAFQRELVAVESSLNGYQNQLQQMQDEQVQAGKSLQDLNKLFDVTGKSVDDFADVLGADLVNAIKEGRASASQLDDAFNRIGQSAVGAEVDINEVRQALQRMDSGSSIDEVRRDLERLGEEANEAEQDVNKLGDGLSALGGIVAGVGIAKVVEEALGASDLNSKIDITFDIPEESKASVRQALADVKSYGVDGEEALNGLQRQWALNKDASDETNASIVKGAASISKAYSEIDFLELIQESNEIGKELKISDEAALDLVNSLLKIGFPASQLDIISEYGGQLQRAGFEAEQIKGIMAAAVNTGSWNIDNLLDGLKEGRIRASELGMGLSNSMKDAVKMAIGDVNKITDAQISAMSESFSEQESALSKSLDKRYDAITKSYDKQKHALSKSLDAEYEAAQKAYVKAEDAKSKSLDKQYDEVAKTYEKQKNELDKALEAELKAYEKASDEKIALIDKEYTEKLKLIDEEKYNKIKAIEAEISNINAVQDAEDKRQKQKEDADKRTELKEKIRTAKDSKSKQEAQKALQEFEEKLRAQKVKDERKAQIDSLKSEKDNINEAFNDKKEALKDEFDEKKNQTKDLLDAEKESLKERQASDKEALATSNTEKLKLLKESNANELSAYKELNGEKLKALKEEQTNRQNMLNERLSSELSAVKDSHSAELASFKKMNAEKLELAKNPPDSASYTAIETQLKNWGDAIAKGGEQGAQAFQDMTKWLDGIEDATLRNAIGIGIYGTKFEDQGQNIIDTVLNMDSALNNLNATQTSVNDNVDKLDDENSLVKFQKAIENIIVALEPLLLVVANVIGAFADFAIEHPKITSAFVAIASVIGVLVGAFAFLAPAIGAIPTILTMVAPAITFISGLFTTLSTVILPAIGAAIAGISAPVVIAIAAIVALATSVLLIFKHWEPIKKFFATIFQSIWQTIKSVTTSIVEFLPKMFGKAKDGVVNAFQFMSNKIKSIWDGLANIVKKPINFMIEMINKLIKGLNKIELPDWMPVIGGKGIDIPEIPMLAKGTDYFRGGKAIVGEKGPELVEMPTGAKVHNANKTADMFGTNNGVVITGNNFTIREESDIKKVAKELYVLQKQGDRGRANR